MNNTVFKARAKAYEDAANALQAEPLPRQPAALAERHRIADLFDRKALRIRRAIAEAATVGGAS